MKKTVFIFFGGVMLWSVMITVNPESAKEGALCGLRLCGETLIPGLFPFMVLGNMLVLCGGGEVLSRFFSAVVQKVLKMNGACTLPVITGLISGVPVGACVTAEMVKNGEISPEEGEKVLCLCGNPGPVFMLSAVPAIIGCNKRAGIVLWASVTVSAFISFLLINRKGSPWGCTSKKSDIKPIAQCVVESVKNAVTSMLNVCGFVIFFSAFLALVPESLGAGKTLITVLSEMTLGCERVGRTAPAGNIRLIFASVVLGWTGFSAHAQVVSAIQGTGMKMKCYFRGKAFQTVIAPLVTIVIIKLFPETLTVNVTRTHPAIITLTSSFMILLIVIIFALLVLSISSESKKQAKK